MTTPPPIPQRPQSQPPPIPVERRVIPTFVYLILIIVFSALNAVWVYQGAIARNPGHLAFALGVVQGGVLIPLVVVGGIACIWKQNRSFRGMVRVLFWASAFFLFVKLSQVVYPTRRQRSPHADGGQVMSATRCYS